MNKLDFAFRKKKFIDNFSKYKKTANYKIIVITIIFLISVFSFVTMLSLDAYDSSVNIITSPKIVLEKNLLPLCVGFVSGVGLATAGSAMQGITRNSLAGPTTLGFLPVATLGIFISQIIGIKKETYLIYLLSFAFSLPALLINYLGNNFKNSSSSYKMILVGLVFGALISSLNAILAVKFVNINANVNLWLGSTELTYFRGNFKWEKFFYSMPMILIAFIVIMFNSKKINILESDVTLAANLGINLKKLYWIVGISSIILTIATVNLVGSTVIIGIVIPHLARMLLQTKNYNYVTPVSSLICGTMLMIGMYLNGAFSLGLNFYTSLISAPIFLYLIIAGKN